MNSGPKEKETDSVDNDRQEAVFSDKIEKNLREENHGYYIQVSQLRRRSGIRQ